MIYVNPGALCSAEEAGSSLPLNLMSGPQAGKTSLVLRTIDALRNRHRAGRFLPTEVRPHERVAADPAKHPGKVTRRLHRLHVHQLIAKIPRSRRWRVSLNGRRVMAAAVKLREVASPSLYAEAAWR